MSVAYRYENSGTEKKNVGLRIMLDTSLGVEPATNAESEKILQEAAALAENAVNEKFPSMPIEQASPSSTTTKYL